MRQRESRHDPGRAAVDSAVMLADGGEAIRDLAVLRGHSELFGPGGVGCDGVATTTIQPVWNAVNCRCLVGGDREALSPTILGACSQDGQRWGVALLSGTRRPEPRPLKVNPALENAQRRPGYGIRHPDLAALLTSLKPAVVERVVWPGNTVLDVAAYPTPTPLPAALVVSVRCIVRVGGCIVVCQAPDTQHVWPGGRRLPGETFERTACREVYEETGWLLDEPDLRLLGFLHFRYADVQPDDHPYPHPDFLQLVYVAQAKDRDGEEGTNWVDLDGWEHGHRLHAETGLGSIGLPAVQRAFINVLPGRDATGH